MNLNEGSVVSVPFKSRTVLGVVIEEAKAYKGAKEVEEKILDLLGGQPSHIDLLVQESSLPAPKVAEVLMRLEIKGLIRQLAGQQFVREA